MQTYYYAGYYDKRKVVVFSSPKQNPATVRSTNQTCNVVLLFITTYCCLFLLFIHNYVIPGFTIPTITPKQPAKTSWISQFTPQVPSSLNPLIYANKLRMYFTPKKLYSDEIPVYYINLESDIERNQHINDHLQQLGFHNIHRVSAWTVEDVKLRVNQRVTSFRNLMNPNLKEIGCIASHLHAMYLAVNDTTNSNPYALIVEDDVRFPFTIDWQAMIEAAPKDFAILQLTTSHSTNMQKLWEEYVTRAKKLVSIRQSLSKWDRLPLQSILRELFSLQDSTTAYTKQAKHDLSTSLSMQLARSQWYKRDANSELWSTQGYIIQKNHLRALLNKLVHANHGPDKQQTLISLLPMPGFPCQHNPCIVPFRVVADIYLYTFFGPTYMSRIPLLNGELHKETIAASSSIQKQSSKIETHRKEFQRIAKIVEIVRSNGSRYDVQSTEKIVIQPLPSKLINETIVHHPSNLPSIRLKSWLRGGSMKEERGNTNNNKDNVVILKEMKAVDRVILPPYFLFHLLPPPPTAAATPSLPPLT